MEEELSKEYKFNNCTYRPTNEETITVHRCKCQGGDYTDTGYRCLKRNIFKITSNVCEHCWAFEKKQ